MMDQTWFEMPEVRKRKLNSAVWIPLRASQKLEAVGHRGHCGFREEYFGAGSIAVPLDRKADAAMLDWSDVGLRHSHAGGMDGGLYVPADIFEDGDLKALALVLEQDGNSDDPCEWHLHQDVALTLGLKREGDTWLAPREGYIEVARLARDTDGSPLLFQFRAEHLKDYLCARGMALYVTSYRSREEVVADAGFIGWADDPMSERSGGDRWEGRTTEISEGGLPFGSSAAIMFVGREDIDAQEDVPAIGPEDENIVTKQWTRKFDGTKLVSIRGEFWRNEWVEPADRSPRVRGDRVPSSVFFVVDAQGTRCAADHLEGTGGWLWFRPEVIMAAIRRRGGALRWYTRHTGGVKSSPGSYMHFGVNALGFVNVFAKDIGFLREWEQQIWAGSNVGPEGGVSEELLAAQAAGVPAETQAPEAFLAEAFGLLNKSFSAEFGSRLFREHADFDSLVAAAHRFRATDEAGLFALAKDLARLTADSIDAAAIQKIVFPPKGEKWGSLKSLEKLLARRIDPTVARSMLGPLAGIYELRHADAHLAGRDLDEAFALAKVDRTQPFVFQGYSLLHSCVSSLFAVWEALKTTTG